MNTKIGATENPAVQNVFPKQEGKNEEIKDKIKNREISAKTISQAYLMEYSRKIESYSTDTFKAQNSLFDFSKIADIFDTIDFEAIGYTGKPLKEITPKEAKELVSEEGFFGVKQTSARLADFVLSGGGDNIDRLKAGREGIIQGFKEAEAIWGEKLPDISYETLNKALETIDQKIESLGGKILDTTA